MGDLSHIQHCEAKTLGSLVVINVAWGISGWLQRFVGCGVSARADAMMREHALQAVRNIELTRRRIPNSTDEPV
jgi:hypothetical protein